MIPGHPQRPGVAEEPQRKQQAERTERHEQRPLRDFGKHHHRQCRRGDDDRRDAVVEIDRAQEVAGLALELLPADFTRFGHAEPAVKQFAPPAARTAQPQGVGQNAPQATAWRWFGHGIDSAEIVRRRALQQDTLVRYSGIDVVTIGPQPAAVCDFATVDLGDIPLRGLGRALQLIALGMPIVAIIMQVANQLTVGKMLIAALAAFSMFYIGRILEGYARE